MTDADPTDEPTLDSFAPDSEGSSENGQDYPTGDEAALPALEPTDFNDYWFDEIAARNEEEGHPERNDPGHSWPVGRFEPHQLGDCPRKWYYDWQNAPEEESDPHGIFAVGHFIEEEIAEPWLRAELTPEYEVDNAIHVSHTVPGTDITIGGSTDPAAIDPESGDIAFLTEIKTTGNLEKQDGPKQRHLYQLHAYLRALDVGQAFLIYFDRNELLHPKVFPVTFDPDTWEEAVDWMEDAHEYALEETLPPAEPPAGWMCRYCEYANRCGKGNVADVSDKGPAGFVPGVEYPREKVVDHLAAHEDVVLTPTLAAAYPAVAADHPVEDWQCPNCTLRVAFDAESVSDWSGGDSPTCPACDDALGQTVPLRPASAVTETPQEDD